MSRLPVRTYLVSYADVTTGDVSHKLVAVVKADSLSVGTQANGYTDTDSVLFYLGGELVGIFHEVASVQCTDELRPVPDDDTKDELEKILVKTNAQP